MTHFKKIRSLFLLTAVLCLFGCSTLNQQSNLSRVHTGQTPTEVSAIIGEPESKSERGGYEIWRYKIYSYDGTHAYPYLPFFKSDRLADFRFDTASNKDDYDLRVKRGNSYQTDPPKPQDPNEHNGNGSPPLQGEPPHLP